MSKQIQQILKDYLQAQGYEGFAGSDGECGCGIDDLFSCGDPQKDCRAAYRHRTNKDGRCNDCALSEEGCWNESGDDYLFCGIR